MTQERMDWDILLSSFEKFCQVDLSLQPRMVESHLYNLKRFIRYVNLLLRQVSVDSIIDYLVALNDNVLLKGNAIKNLRNRLTYLTSASS